MHCGCVESNACTTLVLGCCSSRWSSNVSRTVNVPPRRGSAEMARRLVVEELHLTIWTFPVAARNTLPCPRDNNSRLRETRHITTDSMAPVSFWTTHFKYIEWAARVKPAIFWSIVVGSMGPLTVVCPIAMRHWTSGGHRKADLGTQAIVPPLRHRFGDGPRAQIPLTYPSESAPCH